MKIQPTHWKEVFANHTCNKHICKELSKLSNTETVCFFLMDKKLKQTPKNIHTDGKEAHEKMHNIISHLGNAN